MEELWLQSVEKVVPKVPDQQNDKLSKFLNQMTKYADERVDNMRRQKDEELEQYKRDIERKKRLDVKRGEASATPLQSKNVEPVPQRAQQPSMQQQQMRVKP